MKHRIFATLVAVLFAFAAQMAAGVTWTGAAGDGRWDTAGNWNYGSVPGRGGDVDFPADKSTTIILPAENCKIGGVFTVRGTYVFKAPTPNTYAYEITNSMSVEKGASVTFEGATFTYSMYDGSTNWGGDIHLVDAVLKLTASQQGGYLTKYGIDLTLERSTLESKGMTINGNTITLKDSFWNANGTVTFTESDPSKPTTLTIDNSQIKCKGFPGGTSSIGGSIVFKGDKPQLLINGTCQGKDASNGSPYVSMLFEIPAGGYEGIPITATGGNGFPVNGLIHFTVDPESPVFDSDFEGVVPFVAFVYGTQRGIRKDSATMGVVCDALDPSALAIIKGRGGDFGYRYSTKLNVTASDPVLTEGRLPNLADADWSTTQQDGAMDTVYGAYILGVDPEPGEPTGSVLTKADVSAVLDERTATVSGTITSLGSGETKVYVKVDGEASPILVKTFKSSAKNTSWTWTRELDSGDKLSGEVYLVNGPKDNPTQFTSDRIAFGPLEVGKCPPVISSMTTSAKVDGTFTATIGGKFLDADTVTVTIVQNNTKKTKTGSFDKATGTVSVKFDSLSYGAYECEISMTTDDGTGSKSVNSSIEDKSGLSSVSCTADQRMVTVSGKVSPVGAGTTTVYLEWNVNDSKAYPNHVVLATLSKDSGNASFSWTRHLDNFGDTFYCRVCVTNVAPSAAWGQVAWGTSPSAKSATAVDKAVYSWVADGSGGYDGDWTDPAHWTADKADHADYPNQIVTAATVNFTNLSGRAATIRLPGGTTQVKTFMGDAANITNRFVGAADGSSRLEFTDGGVPQFAKEAFGQWTTFSNLTMLVKEDVSLAGHDQTLEFIDCNVTLEKGGGYFRLGTVDNEGGNLTMIVDNSTVTATVGSKNTGIWLGAVSKATGPCTLVVRGENPKIHVLSLSSSLSSSSHTEETCGQIVFGIPFYGYKEAPITGENSAIKFGNNNSTSTNGKQLRILVDRKNSRALERGSVVWRTYDLVDWPQGIDKNVGLTLDAGDRKKDGSFARRARVDCVKLDDEASPKKIQAVVRGQPGTIVSFR